MFKYHWLCLFLFIVAAVFPVNAQDAEQTEEGVAELSPVTVYLCIVHDGGYNLMSYNASKPLGFMLARSAIVTVFSSSMNNISVDLVHILPDTQTGAYRWVGTIAQNVNTTSNIVDQEQCDSIYPELAEFNRTIALPVSSDQAVIIRQAENILSYETENDFIDSAIGIVFINEAENGFPHMQILGFNNPGDDTIELSFPDFVQNTPIYIVSSRQLSYVTINQAGFESTSREIDPRDTFMSFLNDVGRDLISTILTPGKIRIYVAFGEEITYDQNGVLRVVVASSFENRTFTPGDLIRPISCNPRLLASEDFVPFRVPFFGRDDYNQYVYFMDETEQPPIAGNSTCDNSIRVEAVLPEGILQVNGVYIASWLVDIVE